MGYVFEKRDGVGICKVETPLTAAVADSFRDAALSWMKEDADMTKYILDLEPVTIMDSAGLGSIMAVLKWVSESGGKLVLANLQKKPRMVFELTRATKVFDIYATVDEAVAALTA